MYQITTANGILGYAESASFCYKLSSGSAQIIGRKERGHTATGLVYGGKIYNLPGHDDFDGAETAWATEIDGAVVLNEQAAQLAAGKSALSDLETAMCEADMANAEWQAEVETALCELDGGE